MIKKKKDVIFNSLPRSGNTFLATAFYKSMRGSQEGWGLKDQYRILTHTHSSTLFYIPKRDDVFLFSVYRNPMQLIPSTVTLLSLQGEGQEKYFDIFLEAAIEDCYDFMSKQLEYMNADIIMFKDLIMHTNDVIHYIYEKIGETYFGKIDPEEIKEEQRAEDKRKFADETLYLVHAHTPRGIEKNELYQRAKKEYTLNEHAVELQEMYREIESKASFKK